MGRARLQKGPGLLLQERKFILAKLEAHDAAMLKDVLGDLYRDRVPDPMDITKFESEVILWFMGADAEEIKDVQQRIRVRR